MPAFLPAFFARRTSRNHRVLSEPRALASLSIRPTLTVALFLCLPVLLAAQADWKLAPESQALGYTSEMRRSGCLAATCVFVTPPPSATNAPGNLSRRFDATTFRGQAVRLRAAVRLENPAPGAHAQLWLRVDRAHGETGFFDDMGDRPITGASWRTYEIAADIAADAQAIEFGILITGNARVWVDQAALEVVGPADTAALNQFQQLYGQVDAAYAAGHPEAVASLATADAQVAIGAERLPLPQVLSQAAEQLRQGAQYESRSSVTAVRAGAAEALVSVNNQTTVQSPSKTQTAISASRDTWIKTAAGWKLKQSVLIATRLATPLTGPETARRVATELQHRAVALPAGVAALAAAAGDARMVALGEASYGTREFAEVNRQVIEYLIGHEQFSVVALGANWAEARTLDRYIKTGQGDAAAALRGLNAWPWEIQEVLDLVEWMRARNAAPGPHPMLSFAGFDIAPSPAAAGIVLDYLKRYAPEDTGPAELAYSELRDPTRAATAAAEVAHRLDTEHRILTAASGEEPWRQARQAAAVAWQSTRIRLPGKGQEYRAEAMAANLEWLASAHPNEKIVVWTHNTAVSAAPGGMGHLLRTRYGRQLYTVGYAFAGGALRAVENGELVTRQATPAPAGSGDAVLAAAGLPSFFLDLQHLPAQTELARWLAAPHLFHLTGVAWTGALTPQAPGTLYDGLIFINESHPTEELP